MTTHEISRHKLTLTPGRRYMATRPMMFHKCQRFTVSITDMENDEVVATVPHLSLNLANRLIREFNDRENPLEGRIWA